MMVAGSFAACSMNLRHLLRTQKQYDMAAPSLLILKLVNRFGVCRKPPKPVLLQKCKVLVAICEMLIWGHGILARIRAIYIGTWPRACHEQPASKTTINAPVTENGQCSNT